MLQFKVRTCKYQINSRKKLLILKIKTVKMSRTISSKNLRKKYGNLFYKLSFSKNKNKFVKQKPNKN